MISPVAASRLGARFHSCPLVEYLSYFILQKNCSFIPCSFFFSCFVFAVLHHVNTVVVSSTTDAVANLHRIICRRRITILLPSEYCNGPLRCYTEKFWRLYDIIIFHPTKHAMILACYTRGVGRSWL